MEPEPTMQQSAPVVTPPQVTPPPPTTSPVVAAGMSGIVKAVIAVVVVAGAIGVYSRSQAPGPDAAVVDPEPTHENGAPKTEWNTFPFKCTDLLSASDFQRLTGDSVTSVEVNESQIAQTLCRYVQIWQDSDFHQVAIGFRAIDKDTAPETYDSYASSYGAAVAVTGVGSRAALISEGLGFVLSSNGRYFFEIRTHIPPGSSFDWKEFAKTVDANLSRY